MIISTGLRQGRRLLSRRLSSSFASQLQQLQQQAANPPLLVQHSDDFWQDLHERLEGTSLPQRWFNFEESLRSTEDLNEIYDTEDRQKVKGMGELDYRYIDALVDGMGSTGVLHGLGKSGQMVATVTSLLGGIGGEDPGYSLRTHTLMGTYDELGGMVEAISSGKLPTLGKAYIKENEDSE